MVRNWKLVFSRPLVVVALAVALVCGTPGLARADGGGISDSSGLVWSPPMAGPYSWQQATLAAANYVVVEGGLTYDDWRLPTNEELENAWLDGTIPYLVNARYNLGGAYWSSDVYAWNNKSKKRPRLAYYFYWGHAGNGEGPPLYYGFDIAPIDWEHFSAFFVRGR